MKRGPRYPDRRAPDFEAERNVGRGYGEHGNRRYVAGRQAQGREPPGGRLLGRPGAGLRRRPVALLVERDERERQAEAEARCLRDGLLGGPDGEEALGPRGGGQGATDPRGALRPP